MLLLASASKARHRLLKLAEIPFEVMISGVDESRINHPNPMEMVQLIARAKAKAVSLKVLDLNKTFELNNNPIDKILGCDSAFEFEGEVYGKPINSKQAEIRLQKMSSGTGFLHTGHSLLALSNRNFKNQNIKSFEILYEKVVTTKITFCSLTLSEIRSYVETKEPLTCAGGFALEGRGSQFIKSLDGCYTNVIGLSLPWLRETLLSINKGKA